MDDVLILIEESSREKDEYGVIRQTYAERQVFCRVESVSRAEFFGGGRNGFNPEYKMTMFSGDYQGEALCKYDGLSYGIYRTYHVPGTDYIELYVERKGGANGKKGDA